MALFFVVAPCQNSSFKSKPVTFCRGDFLLPGCCVSSNTWM